MLELGNEKMHSSQMLETVNTGKRETESSTSVLGGIWRALLSLVFKSKHILALL